MAACGGDLQCTACVGLAVDLDQIGAALNHQRTGVVVVGYQDLLSLEVGHYGQKVAGGKDACVTDQGCLIGILPRQDQAASGGAAGDGDRQGSTDRAQLSA